MNPKHERKQREKAGRQRLNQALDRHPQGHLIRQTLQAAIAEGMDYLNVLDVGLRMATVADGYDERDGVKVYWGKFAQNQG